MEEIQRLKDRVKELVQEKSHAIATKNKENVDKKQLQEAKKEIKRLTDKVKELEKSLASKTKENVSKDKKQLEEAVKENKRLTEKVKQLEAGVSILHYFGRNLPRKTPIFS